MTLDSQLASTEQLDSSRSSSINTVGRFLWLSGCFENLRLLKDSLAVLLCCFFLICLSVTCFAGEYLIIVAYGKGNFCKENLPQKPIFLYFSFSALPITFDCIGCLSALLCTQGMSIAALIRAHRNLFDIGACSIVFCSRSVSQIKAPHSTTLRVDDLKTQITMISVYKIA